MSHYKPTITLCFFIFVFSFIIHSYDLTENSILFWVLKYKNSHKKKALNFFNLLFINFKTYKFYIITYLIRNITYIIFKCIYYNLFKYDILKNIII